jgi:FixJ family two-component response regulator
MTEADSIVFVVDDDPSVRRAIKRLVGPGPFACDPGGAGKGAEQTPTRIGSCGAAGAGRIVSGMLNKQIAVQIGIAENTVKCHRSRAMEKMQANSLAELVQMMARLQIPSAPRS